MAGMHTRKRIANRTGQWPGMQYKDTAEKTLDVAEAREWQYERFTVYQIESCAGTCGSSALPVGHFVPGNRCLGDLRKPVRPEPDRVTDSPANQL